MNMERIPHLKARNRAIGEALLNRYEASKSGIERLTTLRRLHATSLREVKLWELQRKGEEEEAASASLCSCL
jgi:hypothetical protein